MPTGPAQSGADTPQAQDLNTDLQTPDAQQQETPEQQQGSEKAEKLTEAQEKAMNEKRKSIQKELKNFEKHHNEATGEVKEAFKDGIQKVKEVFKNYESGKLVEEEAHKTFKSEISTIFRSIQHTDRYSHDGESQQEKSDRKERRKKLLKKYEAFRGELLNQAETGSPAMQKAAKKTLASLQKNLTTKTEKGVPP
jgi:hypothetical protein